MGCESADGVRMSRPFIAATIKPDWHKGPKQGVRVRG